MKKLILISLSSLMLIGILGCGAKETSKKVDTNQNVKAAEQKDQNNTANMDHSNMSNMDHSNMNMDNQGNKK